MRKEVQEAVDKLTEELKQPKYIVVTGDDFTDLANKVNAKIEDGYKCQGGLTTNGMSRVQAMVLYG